jgi:hypothetical protein
MLPPHENDQEQWPEHAVCARCAAPLDKNFQVSPLGLRFCKDCFDGTVQEKVKERAAAIYVKGKCSNCGRSLINGYRMNQFGVLYCLSCSDPSTAGAEAKQEEYQDNGSEEVSSRTAPSALLLIAAIILSHLLFLLDFALPAGLFHGKTFFRPLVSLDLLTLLLMAASRRISVFWFQFWFALLLALAFAILILGEITAIFS